MIKLNLYEIRRKGQLKVLQTLRFKVKPISTMEVRLLFKIPKPPFQSCMKNMADSKTTASLLLLSLAPNITSPTVSDLGSDNPDIHWISIVRLHLTKEDASMPE